MAAEPKVQPRNSARSRCPVDMARNQFDSARGSPPCQLVVRSRVSTSDSCDTSVMHVLNTVGPVCARADL